MLIIIVNDSNRTPPIEPTQKLLISHTIDPNIKPKRIIIPVKKNKATVLITVDKMGNQSISDSATKNPTKTDTTIKNNATYFDNIFKEIKVLTVEMAAIRHAV